MTLLILFDLRVTVPLWDKMQKMICFNVSDIHNKAAFCFFQIKLVNIHATDIADGRPSIVLGLIWTVILYFQVTFD